MYKTLDPEWVELLKEARMMGLDPEEIRTFLKQTKAGDSPTVTTANPLN